MTARTWIANSRLVGEQFDEEVVIIDIEKGLYFSLRGGAVTLWHLLQVGRDEASLLASFPADASGAATETLARMEELGLVVAASDSPQPLPSGTAVFALAAVEVYSDLSELIAIDPVHEVDSEAGWPNRPPSFPESA